MNELQSMWKEVAMISAAGSSWHLPTESENNCDFSQYT